MEEISLDKNIEKKVVGRLNGKVLKDFLISAAAINQEINIIINREGVCSINLHPAHVSFKKDTILASQFIEYNIFDDEFKYSFQTKHLIAWIKSFGNKIISGMVFTIYLDSGKLVFKDDNTFSVELCPYIDFKIFQFSVSDYHSLNINSKPFIKWLKLIRRLSDHISIIGGSNGIFANTDASTYKLSDIVIGDELHVMFPVNELIELLPLDQVCTLYLKSDCTLKIEFNDNDYALLAPRIETD